MKRRKLTKAQSRRLLLAALAKCKKVWATADYGFYFPSEAMITIETIINDILEQNR